MNELQEPDELADDAVNKMRQLMEKWKNRLTLDNLRLSERYLKAEITIFIFWDIRGASHPQNLCAVLENGKRPIRLSAERCGNLNLEDDLRRIAPHINGWSGDTADSGNGHKQEMVLINNVQTVEFPETSIPTIVRLEQVDEAFRPRLHSLYFSPIMGFVFGRSFVNGKARLVRRRAASSLYQFPRQVVESAPQVVNGVPGDQRETVGNRNSRLGEMDFLSSLSIMLDSESIRVCVPVVKDSVFQITDVVIGPFDFRPDGEQSARGRRRRRGNTGAAHVLTPVGMRSPLARRE
jgi:hypothetical protein